MGNPAGRIIFAGSPDFAVPTLAAVAESGREIVAVLTQPDRPAGRGRRARASPVKEFAIRHGLPVLQPASLKRDPGVYEELQNLRPDLMVVVAYGLILPRPVLDLPRRGCVNVHASLLPRWRGAAPIPAAILAGDRETGITLMQLEEGLDTGPVIAIRQIAIGDQDSAADLRDRLAPIGAALLLEHLDALLAGEAHPVAQPGEGVTYAPKLAKADASIDWREDPALLHRRIRAYNPWPVAETRLDGAQLRCWSATPIAGVPTPDEPGTVIRSSAEGIDVRCGDGLLRLLSVQLAGRQRVTAGEFGNGHALAGKVLGV